MDKNKIKKYLKETFLVESYINNYKYNIKAKNGTPMDTDNVVWTYVDNHGGEDGWFKSEDGHWVQIDDESKFIVSQIRNLNEDTKPVGLKNTEKVQEKSKKENQDAVKDVETEIKDYIGDITGDKENSESVKKYENDDTQNDIVNNGYQQGSLANLDPVNPSNQDWIDMQKKAMTGENSNLGNSNEYANVYQEEKGFKGPKANLYFYNKSVEYKKGKEKAEYKYKRLSTSINGADFDDSKINENHNKVKRLIFKKPFNGVGNTLQLIPEKYKVDGKLFHMTDGNENYEIRWEGSLNEGRAIILKAEDKNMISEDFNHMKHLMNFKPQDTSSMGTRKSIRESLDEMNNNE